MPVYHQMGYQSDNLITCTELTKYKGAILSPVDYSQQDLQNVMINFGQIKGFETIFDPQLYFPKTQRARLREWSYFPVDVDTADHYSIDWWERVNTNLLRVANELHPSAMCSPIINPRSFSDEYYSFMICIGNDFYERINPLDIKVYQSIIINLPDLIEIKKVLAIASIISKTKASFLYLIFHGDTPPRREFCETLELIGAMNLIRILEANGIKVLVGFCSSDIVLWKEAGASSCATGKFFNLRRYTPSRWDPSEEGGHGQLPYWFEEGLLAYIREADFIRSQKVGILSLSSQSNPYFSEIKDCINSGKPWLALAWRQYLWWFQNIELKIFEKSVTVFDLLDAADKNWSIIEKKRVYFDERQNDGSWIRAWLKAITESHI